MGLLGRILGRRDAVGAYAPLYAAVVRVARRPDWYRDAGVPDTLDGRFDMVASVLALVLLRLEAGGDAGRAPAARVTELFVTDMDGQLRQQGIGDIVVGKHIGKMMAQLGGRLAAYREGLAPGGDLAGVIDRNLHRGAETPLAARAHAEALVRTLANDLAARDVAAIVAGDIA